MKKLPWILDQIKLQNYVRHENSIKFNIHIYLAYIYFIDKNLLMLI